MAQLERTNSLTSWTKYLLAGSLVLLLLYFGRALLIPMSFGLLIAIIVYPAAKLLEKKGMGRGVTIGLLITGIIVIFLSLLGVLFYEMGVFLEDIGEVKKKFTTLFSDLGTWIEKSF